jgi:threonine aldolase
MDHIELRSDTMTVLTPEMRASILTSSYGDWTYGEDETVK